MWVRVLFSLAVGLAGLAARASDTLTVQKGSCEFSLLPLDRESVRGYVNLVFRPIHPRELAPLTDQGYVNLADSARLEALRRYNRYGRMSPFILFDELGLSPFAAGIKVYPFEDERERLLVTPYLLRIRNNGKTPLWVDFHACTALDTMGNAHPALDDRDFASLLALRTFGKEVIPDGPGFSAAVRQWVLAWAVVRAVLWRQSLLWPDSEAEGIVIFPKAVLGRVQKIAVPCRFSLPDGGSKLEVVEFVFGDGR